MRLIVNGCSFTAGFELENPKEHAWPKILFELLGFSHHENISLSGSSNKRIFRTTLNYISKLDNNDYDKYFFTIGWSHPLRTEIFLDEYLRYYQVTPRSEGLYKDLPILHEQVQRYFKYQCAPIWNSLETLQDIISLQSIFKSLNIKYLMFNTFFESYFHVEYPVSFKKEPFQDSIFTSNRVDIIPDYLVKLIDEKFFIRKDCMQKYIDDLGVPWKNHHPLEEGHQKWAEYLHKYITENNII